MLLSNHVDFKPISETFLELCQRSMMEIFEKTINDF